MTGALGPKGDRWRKYRGQKHAQSASSYKGLIPAFRRLGLESTQRCFALNGPFVWGCNYNYSQFSVFVWFWAAVLGLASIRPSAEWSQLEKLSWRQKGSSGLVGAARLWLVLFCWLLFVLAARRSVRRLGGCRSARRPLPLPSLQPPGLVQPTCRRFRHLRRFFSSRTRSARSFPN